MDVKKRKFSLCMVLTKSDSISHFEEAAISIKNQTYPPNEIIIVKNGGITQSHYTVAKKHLPDAIFLDIKENKTIGFARNLALDFASSGIIAVADPDDINELTRFAETIPLLNENSRMVGAYVREFHIKPYDKSIYRKVPCNPLDIIAYSKYRSPVNNPTVCYFKKDALEVGGYNKKLKYGEDYDLAMAFIRAGKQIYNLPKSTVNFRSGSKHKTHLKRSGLRLLKEEISLHYFFLKNKDITYMEFIKIASLKFFFRLLPRKPFMAIYNKSLREKI